MLIDSVDSVEVMVARARFGTSAFPERALITYLIGLLGWHRYSKARDLNMAISEAAKEIGMTFAELNHIVREAILTLQSGGIDRDWKKRIENFQAERSSKSPTVTKKRRRKPTTKKSRS